MSGEARRALPVGIFARVLSMLSYCGAFLFLAGIPLLYHLGGSLWPPAGVATLAVVLTVLERFPSRPPASRAAVDEHRLLPLLYIPLQLGVIAWAIRMAAASSPAPFLALALAVGVSAGVFGMLAAHELVHSHRRLDRLVAFAMLAGMSSPQFRIAHIFGHHRWAGTERDPATARLSEGFYAFLVRTFLSQWKEVWAFGRRPRRSRKLGNYAWGDVITIVLAYGAVAAASGARGAFFFFCQSVVAIVVLELFNYIAHYGLEREMRSDGRPAPLADWGSWNSSSELANLLLFNMGRHSDHHRRPSVSYSVLSPIAGAPELPLGYAGSILLALFPPWWRRVMDPCVSRAMRRPNAAQPSDRLK